jgi:spermidine synthase
MVALMIALAVAMYVQARAERKNSFARTRNFYGVLAVKLRNAGSPTEHYELVNGRIAHGSQYRDPANHRVPTEYFTPHSGVGQLMMTPRPAPRRVALVGLGAGTLAAYAESGDDFRFYEINPLVVEFADQYFTFLQDARQRGANITIIEGDARLSLERESSQNCDLLVLDAFTGDSIPMHLLTFEAFELYLRHLKKPEGALAVHVSNIHLDLKRVVLAAAQRFHLAATYVESFPDEMPATSAADWILLHRRAEFFAEHPMGVPLEQAVAPKPPVAWTDEYSNLLEILK